MSEQAWVLRDHYEPCEHFGEQFGAIETRRGWLCDDPTTDCPGGREVRMVPIPFCTVHGGKELLRGGCEMAWWMNEHDSHQYPAPWDDCLFVEVWLEVPDEG